MKYFEFGLQNETLMVLLHGGGVCYRGVLPVAERLSKDFHVIVVAYNGFNPTEPDTEFVSVMDEAKRLGDYIVEHHGGKIDILYALSYGCRVLLEVLADEHLTITTTIADGMSMHDYPNIKSKLDKEIYLFFFTGFFYQMMGKAGPMRKKADCQADRKKAGGSRAASVPECYMAKLEESGCLSDWPPHEFRGLQEHPYAYLARDQQPGGAETGKRYQKMAGCRSCLYLQSVPQRRPRWFDRRAYGAVC